MDRNEKEAMFEYDHRLNRLTKTHAYQYKNLGDIEAEEEEVEIMPGKRKLTDLVEQGRWSRKRAAMNKLAQVFVVPDQAKLMQQYGAHVDHPKARRLNNLPEKFKPTEGYDLNGVFANGDRMTNPDEVERKDFIEFKRA